MLCLILCVVGFCCGRALSFALGAGIFAWRAEAMKRKQPTTQDRYEDTLTLGKVSFVSKSGMHNLLKAVDDDNMPDHYSRSTQYRARKATCSIMTSFGTLLDHRTMKKTNGQDMEFGLANPFALFEYQCQTSEHFSQIVREALDRYPCSPAQPWGLILYSDAVDPSDGLAKHHGRKSVVYYFSFLQFGMRACI